MGKPPDTPPRLPWVSRAARWIGATPGRARRVQVAAAVLAFQGTAFVLVANKLALAHPSVFFAGFGMIAAGAFLLVLPSLGRPARPARTTLAQAAQAQAPRPTLGDAFIDRVTMGGRLTKVFPLLGALVVAFDLLFNRYLTTSPELLSTDFVVLGLGAILIAFPFMPETLRRERNFLLLFFAALTLIFGVPLMALRLGRDPYASVDEYTAALLTPQLSALLSAFGVPTSYVSNILWYPDLTTGGTAAVYIATSCSGLYSMGIFMAAFAALVLTEYPRLTARVAALLALGLCLAYVANLMRMVVIVEAGHHYGAPALLWVHANLGDLIFLLWVAPFLWLTFRLLDPSKDEAREAEADRFACALAAQGIDPAAVTDADWFCAECFAKVDAPEVDGPAACPQCGAALG